MFGFHFWNVKINLDIGFTQKFASVKNWLPVSIRNLLSSEFDKTSACLIIASSYPATTLIHGNAFNSNHTVTIISSNSVLWLCRPWEYQCKTSDINIMPTYPNAEYQFQYNCCKKDRTKLGPKFNVSKMIQQNSEHHFFEIGRSQVPPQTSQTWRYQWSIRAKRHRSYRKHIGAVPSIIAAVPSW